MGHRSIVDKSSAYGAKGPGFKPRWRQEFINIKCMFCSFEKIKLLLGPTIKKKVLVSQLSQKKNSFASAEDRDSTESDLFVRCLRRLRRNFDAFDNLLDKSIRMRIDILTKLVLSQAFYL